MNIRHAAPTAALALLTLPAASANAHVIAGARVFPVTLTIDDPGTADEASIPAFTYSRDGSNGGSGPTHHFGYGFEYDKTITPNTAIILNDGYLTQQIDGAKTQAGFGNLFVTGKWEFYLNAEHELVSSVGVIREIGGTGASHTGGDRYGSTAPTIYFGKGLGDLAIGFFRPLAVSGELSYVVADRKLKQVQQPAGSAALPMFNTGIAAQFNNGANNAWAAGVSVQYSLPYLQSQVRDIGLPPVVRDIVPLVEVTWSSPASTPSAKGTTWTVAPGAAYVAEWGEIGVEALIPLNKATGTTVGAVALVHVFLEDLLPNTLGRPLIP